MHCKHHEKGDSLCEGRRHVLPAVGGEGSSCVSGGLLSKCRFTCQRRSASSSEYIDTCARCAGEPPPLTVRPVFSSRGRRECTGAPTAEAMLGVFVPVCPQVLLLTRETRKQRNSGSAAVLKIAKQYGTKATGTDRHDKQESPKPPHKRCHG